MATPTPPTLRFVESQLARQRPYGDPAYINGCIDRVCEHRLGIAAQSFERAAQLLSLLSGAPAHAKHHFLRDTVARIAVDQAAIVSRGTEGTETREQIEELLAQATALLERRWAPALIESGFSAPLRMGESATAPLLWTRRCTDDAAWRCFARASDVVMHERTISELHSAQIATVQSGLALLAALLPELGASALSHAVAIAVTEHPTDTPHKGFKQGTFSTLPGTLFLSARAISDPWEVAEAVLHEAMHLKFIDLEYTHSMRPLAPAPTITPPWHRVAPAPPAWPVTRAMTAMHVYVVLSLFFAVAETAAAELIGPFGERPPAKRKRQALDRAHYLLQQLDARRESIGAAGQRFLTWIRPLLLALDPEPPASDSELHLVLDLYERELEEVGASIAHWQGRNGADGGPLAARAAEPQDWRRMLDGLVQSESERSQAILSRMGLRLEPLESGDAQEVAEVAAVAELAPLSRLRRGVAAALRSLPVARVKQADEAQGSAEALVRELVQASGSQIHQLLGSLS
ncbi:MAG TPA: hypothetical protein VFS67_10110 [Polyangiaceae bacterium]|nr:hypothetical protein [Polyangiaceae bacterium]